MENSLDTLVNLLFCLFIQDFLSIDDFFFDFLSSLESTDIGMVSDDSHCTHEKCVHKESMAEKLSVSVNSRELKPPEMVLKELDVATSPLSSESANNIPCEGSKDFTRDFIGYMVIIGVLAFFFFHRELKHGFGQQP